MQSAALAAALCLPALPAGAHHSLAIFDRSEEVAITGEIIQVRYASPHVMFSVETTGADGEPTVWRFETYGPGRLTRKGVERDSIPVGAQATVTGYPARNGEQLGLWINAVLEDGTVLDPDPPRPPRTLRDRPSGTPGRSRF